MGLCIYLDDGSDVVKWYIWDSMYSTFATFCSDANVTLPFYYHDSNKCFWKYQDCLKLAQDLRVALSNKEFNEKWGFRTETFIKGLEGAYESTVNVVVS